jgi:cyclic beta-1,2-glucan synthetase
MSSGILIGYYAKRDEARRALRGLIRQGFRRITLVRKGTDGTVHIGDPFLWRLAFGIVVAAFLSGSVGGVISLVMQWSQPFSDWHISTSLALITLCAVSGVLAATLWLRRSRYGVDPQVMRDHVRWLVPGETVLILQAPVELLQGPLVQLRESSDPPPALFVMHPRWERRETMRITTVKLSPAQIVEHALRHAREQVVELKQRHSPVLLDRLKQCRQQVRHICAVLTIAIRLEQKATPAADWILDNEYILEGNARDVLLNLPRRFFQQLPVLASEPNRGFPCIYDLAKNLVSHTELRLDQENILTFIEAYQSVRALKIGELWAIPQMLRIALIESIQNLAVTALADLRERQLAEFWANRLIASNRRDHNQLFAILAELVKAKPNPNSYFGAQLVGLLYDEETALTPVQSWLERSLKKPLHEITQQEQIRQTREQLSCGNAFTSLRQLALLDWRMIFEKLSRVEQTLRRDPARIYPDMDFPTRDRCRGAIEELAHTSGQSEEMIAERVVILAARAVREKNSDERRSHVGSWLVGDGRAELAELLPCRETLRYRILEWVYRHHTAVYAFGITLFSLLFILLIASFRPVVPSLVIRLGLLLMLIPVSQVAIEIVNYLITRLLPPRSLPKMDYEISGIPDAFRTLVVVPMMLTGADTIRAEVEKLEIRYLANKETNLIFSLFTDYTDAVTRSCSDDSKLLLIATECLTELNLRHGSGLFFLFHRERLWSESEQNFIGWERKRGKLEELNRLIDGTRAESADRLVYVGDPDQLANVRFVITLDSDTQLPHGTARRMVETLAHPLNQPRYAADGSIMAGTYTIIQPRVSPTLPSTSVSIFSRLFADAVGIDPYTQATSDVYQDLSGEGSYHGKGIYDVRAFSRVLSGRFPEAWILSHDLIEGAHVRVGLASDIELYDEFPQGYQSYSKRTHRWIRGDWQIAGWIFPRVPRAGGGYDVNQLSLLNRWKILDNLRRSLVPATSLGLLVVSWCISPRVGGIATLVVGIELLFHPLAQPITMATTPKGLKYFSPAKLLHDLTRAIADAALLPHQAAITLDAIGRVWYRRMFSRRNLLEWSAQATEWKSSRSQPLFVATLTLGSLFSVSVGWALWFIMPASLPQALPWLGLWFLSPLLAWFLNLRPVQQVEQPLPEADRRFLRQVSRKTWRYFTNFVSAETSWLPPDNFQVAHQNQLAMRTSPTNIGLWMTAVVGAHDSGYLTITQVIEKLSATMETLNRMERYNGHLLNWYDIGTLAPLLPRYVSTVDSGNLLGALWTLERGIEELLHTPLVNRTLFDGLADTGEILKQSNGLQKSTDLNRHILDRLLSEWHAPPTGIVARLRLIRQMKESVDAVFAAAGGNPWGDELNRQFSAWAENCDRNLSWVEILAEKNADELASLGHATIQTIRQDLVHAPSLSELADGRINSILILQTIRNEPHQDCLQLVPWIDRVIESFATSRWLAGETLARAEQLIAGIRTLSAGMNMGFLYQSTRKLFSIGFNVSTDVLDGSSYDLLASEARLGSFVAIARGDVPMEHWFSLGRPYGAVGRQRVLLSWTGTMFEYLMPLLLQKSYDKSLLDKAARDAVTVQIAYGRTRSVPWGISESAYADLDLAKTYQYQAFGVPALGLKRGLEDQLVVAPYATLLALAVAPGESVQNLKRLAALGMLGEYGYYEAMDFSRQTQRIGRRGVIIEAYMAHHQGMAFLALVNVLHGNPFPRRFHEDPRVRAFEALLQERIPTLPPLQLISTRQNLPTPRCEEQIAPSVVSFSTPHTATPRTLLLSNGRYGVMVTNSGGGYSQWGGLELTRWRSDPTCDSHGIFCYVHETDLERGRDRLWSNTYHPVGGTVKGYTVDFALDRAVFHRIDSGIHTETEVVVSPEDDVEVRRITLINRSSRRRHLKLTSYIELSMAPHNVDRQHPAFNKLFIQTEALPEQRVLLAYRRPRSDTETPLFVAHQLTINLGGDGSMPELQGWQFETDRGRFIGRGRTLANPMGAEQDLSNSQGFVLDPMLGQRQCFVLEPGQRAQLSLVFAAGNSRETVLLLMDKYRAHHTTERALDFAWGSAQQQLQLLHIQPDEARRFQQLAGHLLFPNHLLRAPADRIEENCKGQSGLWPYTISGDLPIILVTIGEPREISLVRQTLQAHTYWRMHGLSTDLVILNEEAGSYEQPLQDQLLRLIQSHTVAAATDRAGGIYLKSAAQIPEEDLTLLKAVASVMLVAARGSLPQQLGMPTDPPELPEQPITKRLSRDPSAPLPFMELHYFNSLGGFTPDGSEYAIYLGPGTNTPAPWVNIIANPTFGCMVSETGAGFTWYGNSQRNRLTGWSNDPALDPISEALYLRDEESGDVWSPTAAPIREESAYRARHGAGYSLFEHNSHGIDQELTLFVPVDENGGQPIKLQRLRLTNTTPRRRRVSATYYVELTLGENSETSRMQVVTSWDEETQAMLAVNRYHPEYGNRVTFAAMTPEADSYSGDRTTFIGRNRSLADPAAMTLSRLSLRTGAGLDPCAAIRVTVDLAPGEMQEITCMLGQAVSAAEATLLVLRYREDRAVESALDQTVAWWNELLGTIEVHTPELAADLLINRWLQYQSISCRIWGRSAYYQSGGAFGFRDQLQDVMACLYAKPGLAREQILLAASRQFTEGDVQHWWHPPSGAGIRSRISDDLLWLPYVVAHYVRTTGDVDLLSTEVPFLEAPPLETDQHELYSIPGVAGERATLFEHCRRAAAHGLTTGPHGLPLMGTGDWNDGLNLVGAGGKGESVWLAWFLCDVLQGMAELSTLMLLPELHQKYLADRSALIGRIEQAGWDGAWYLRGTFDDGSPLGSAANAEARIDSLPQTWAWLSGVADPARAEQGLESAWQHLVCQEEGIVLLFEPPFNTSQPSPGYIKGYPPGVRENGGQYTHAGIWMAMAFARKGDGERAVQLLRMLNPIEHARDAEAVWRYGVEPYVVSADVYRLPGRVGRGGWSWYTGSAAWMYRAWIEEVLGLELRNGLLQVNPVIPGSWPGFTLTYRHGEAQYTITVKNPDGCQRGVVWMEMDGRRVPDATIILEKNLVKHQVVVMMGNSGPKQE